MLILAPLGESRQVLEDVARVGVKDMRPIFVDQDAVVVVLVVGVAADMRTLVDDQHLNTRPGGEPLGQDTTGEAGTNDQVIEHGGTLSVWM
jgi:hypothetical protein